MSDHNASENTGPNASCPVVDELDEKDLPEAARIVRVAFGTFLGAPDPETFWADRTTSMAATVRLTWPHSARRWTERLVGSNFRDQLGKRWLLWADYCAS